MSFAHLIERRGHDEQFWQKAKDLDRQPHNLPPHEFVPKPDEMWPELEMAICDAWVEYPANGRVSFAQGCGWPRKNHPELPAYWKGVRGV